MLPKNMKDFTVEHDAFYKELKQWREGFLNSQETNECVYFLISNQVIPRVLHNDYNGILYIGKGVLDRNNERIGALINSVNETSDTHKAGNRFQKIRCKYPIEGLTLSIQLIENAREKEEYYLKRYGDCYGELPPLNRQA